MRRMVAVAFCLCLALLSTSGCSKSAPPPPAGKMQVVAGIAPIAYLAEKVGGENVSVMTLVTAGQSPHSYEAVPSQIVAVSKAKVFLASGWTFEQQLLNKLKEINRTMAVVDMRQGVTLRYMTADEVAGEAHEHEGDHAAEASHEHEQGEPDPHIWLSPRNAVIMTEAIVRSFAAADPEHAADYEKNGASLEQELGQLDKELTEALAPLKGKKFFTYHPAFGYFADAYGLIQIPVEIEGKEPGFQQLNRFIEMAKEAGVKVIFVQPQFSARSAQTVAEKIGGAVVKMDDLSHDYIENFRDMARKIAAALKAGEGNAP